MACRSFTRRRCRLAGRRHPAGRQVQRRPSDQDRGQLPAPDSNGGTDRFAQASILNLYDPDRATRFTGAADRNARTSARFLSGAARQTRAEQRRPGTELSARAQQFAFAATASEADCGEAAASALVRARADGFRHSSARRFARLLANRCSRSSVRPSGRHCLARLRFPRFRAGRAQSHPPLRPAPPTREARRLSPNRSVCGRELDDHYRLQCGPSVARCRAARCFRLPPLSPAEICSNTATSRARTPGQRRGRGCPKWISECAQDLLANARQIAGGCRAIASRSAVHLLAYAINAALGNVGQNRVFHEVPGTEASRDRRTGAGAATPARSRRWLSWAATRSILRRPIWIGPMTQRKAKMVARLGYYEDETFPYCDWHLPAAHYLESWGDALTSDGTLVPIQPLIAPLLAA